LQVSWIYWKMGKGLFLRNTCVASSEA